MNIFVRNGKRFNIRGEMVIDGVTYIDSYLRSPAGMAALGISEISVPDIPDSRFYFATESETTPYVHITERNLEECKKSLISQIKQTTGSLLLATDWQFTRQLEGVKAVPQSVLDERALIRIHSDQNELAVSTMGSIADLAALQLTWPQKDLKEMGV